MALLDNSTELNQKLPKKNTKQKRQKTIQNKKRQTNFFLWFFYKTSYCCYMLSSNGPFNKFDSQVEE